MATGVQAVLGGALRALERPDKVFWPYMLSTIGTLTVGVAMILVWGLTGATYSLVLAAVSVQGG